MKTHKQSAFTLIELLVVISIIAIIAAMAMPAFTSIMARGRQTDQMNNGRSIYLAMRNYASETSHAGSFPAYKDPDDANTTFSTTNDLGEVLVPRYLDAKGAFNNKASAWCKLVAKEVSTANQVLSGECDWCYVVGLKDTTDSRWPILANAFANPGSPTYVKDTTKKGGVWKGEKAIVIYAGGTAEIAETSLKSEAPFVKRPDRPGSNAFEPDETWLNGDGVKVLYPKN